MIKLLWIEVRAGKVRSRGGRRVSTTRIDSRQTQKLWATWVWKWPSELKTSDMRMKVMVRTRNDASHTSKWEKDGNFQCHDGDGKTRFSLFYSQYSRCGKWWNTLTLCSIFFFCTNLSLSLFGSQPSSSFLLNATLVATYTSVHLPSLQALLEANTLLIAAEETYRTNARDH